MFTVLLIDDNLDLININSKYLQLNGYNVNTANTGYAALEILNNFIPHCIVLEVVLPDMSGLDLCHKIRKLSSVPIIFLSSLGSEPDIINGFIFGGNDYMVKPYSVKELSYRITAHIKANILSEHPPLKEDYFIKDKKLYDEDLLKYVLNITENPSPLTCLTKREVEVLSKISKASNNKEIADELFISEYTVKKHVSNILSKLHLKNRRDAMLYAIDNHI